MRRPIFITFALTLVPVVSFAANIKLINDTKTPIRIHTGTGLVKINKGGSTSFTCRPGKKIYSATENTGKKKKLIFKVDSNHCGKTIRLTSVM